MFTPRQLKPKYPLADHVLVHLHIPKSGGSSFGESLLRLDYDRPCVARENRSIAVEHYVKTFGRLEPKSFLCLRQDDSEWMFSRYSTGWPCGVHPMDRLRVCVPQYLGIPESKLCYVTTLRNPVERLISEFMEGVDGWSRWNDGFSPNVPISIASDYYCNGTLRVRDAPCSEQMSNLLLRSTIMEYSRTKISRH